MLLQLLHHPNRRCEVDKGRWCRAASDEGSLDCFSDICAVSALASYLLVLFVEFVAKLCGDEDVIVALECFAQDFFSEWPAP